jgi:hypothetical protein
MGDITSWECSIDGTLQRKSIYREREPALGVVAFIAFYRPPREPTNYSIHCYKCGCFTYIMGFLSLEVFYVVSEVTKSWSVGTSMMS